MFSFPLHCTLPVVEGLMHLAPACALWLLLGVAVIEWPAMAREGALDLMRARPLLYLSAAAMGFLVNSLAYVVIQTANSLTLKVLGTVKNAMVVWIGVVFIGDVITGLQVSSFLLAPAQLILGMYSEREVCQDCFIFIILLFTGFFFKSCRISSQAPNKQV